MGRAPRRAPRPGNRSRAIAGLERAHQDFAIGRVRAYIAGPVRNGRCYRTERVSRELAALDVAQPSRMWLRSCGWVDIAPRRSPVRVRLAPFPPSHRFATPLRGVALAFLLGQTAGQELRSCHTLDLTLAFASFWCRTPSADAVPGTDITNDARRAGPHRHGYAGESRESRNRAA
jgi:hypothetical protein